MRIGVGTVECRDTVTVTTQKDVRRVALASAIGTTIEWYDFFIYGTAAAVVFGRHSFPRYRRWRAAWRRSRRSRSDSSRGPSAAS